MKKIDLSAPGWEVTAASLAESFLDRLLGVRHPHAGDTVVIATGMVHTVGLERPLEIVALSRGGVVLEARTVPPNRVVRFPGGRYAVEMPEGSVVPPVGATVEMFHG